MRIDNKVGDFCAEKYDDIWISVFSYLTILDRVKLEQVCRRWCRLARISWNNVHCLNFDDLLGTDREFVTIRDSNKALLFILKRSGWFLTKLNFSLESLASGWSSDDLLFDAKTLRNIGRLCQNLVDINLSHLHLNNQALEAISDHCNSKLQILTLRRCFEYESSPDIGISKILDSFPLLSKLDLSDNDTLSGQCFMGNSADLRKNYHVTSNQSLRELKLNKCHGLQSKFLIHLASKYPNLTKFECTEFTQPLGQILSRLIRLTHLNLNSFQCKSDLEINSCWFHLTKLSHLDLGHSCLVTDQIMKVLSQTCGQNVEFLDISGRNDQLSADFVKSLTVFKRLSYLDISWLEFIDEAMLRAMTGSGHLKSLHAHACVNLTAAGLFYVARSNQRLNALHITSCNNIDDGFFSCLSRYCSIKRRKITVYIDSNQAVNFKLDNIGSSFFMIKILN